MVRDIHKTEFEEGTFIKLFIFESYIKEWLPVFIKIKDPWWNRIYIYDFFAGPGQDSAGNPGSPLILLRELKPFCLDLHNKKLQLHIIFNEYSRKKYKTLVENCNTYLNECRNNPEYHCPTAMMVVFLKSIILIRISQRYFQA
jgi:three-Cys-motif partner protein